MFDYLKMTAFSDKAKKVIQESAKCSILEKMAIGKVFSKHELTETTLTFYFNRDIKEKLNAPGILTLEERKEMIIAQMLLFLDKKKELLKNEYKVEVE